MRIVLSAVISDRIGITVRMNVSFSVVLQIAHLEGPIHQPNVSEAAAQRRMFNKLCLHYYKGSHIP